MPSITLKKRKYRTKEGEIKYAKNYTAIIRFGRQHEFSRSTGCTTEREARAWAKREAERIEREDIPRINSPQITIDNLFGFWWSEYASKTRSSETMKQRGGVVMNLLGADTILRDVDDERVSRLVTELEHGRRGKRSEATINRHIDILRKAITLGKKKWKSKRDQFHEIDWSDIRQREAKERVVFITPDEVRALLANLPYHIGLAVAWSVYTGCRLNETRTLKWSRVHMDGGWGEVFAKGGYYRAILLSDIAVRILRVTPRYGKAVFDLTNRRRHWEAARKAINRPELRWHDLRHCSASFMGQFANASLKTIGRQLGHADEATTGRYRHVADEELKTALNAIPDFTDGFLNGSSAKPKTHVGC